MLFQLQKCSNEDSSYLNSARKIENNVDMFICEPHKQKQQDTLIKPKSCTHYFPCSDFYHRSTLDELYYALKEEEEEVKKALLCNARTVTLDVMKVVSRFPFSCQAL